MKFDCSLYTVYSILYTLRVVPTYIVLCHFIGTDSSTGLWHIPRSFLFQIPESCS